MDRMETLSVPASMSMHYFDFGAENSPAEALWEKVLEELIVIDNDLACRVDDLRFRMVGDAWDIGAAFGMGFEPALGNLSSVDEILAATQEAVARADTFVRRLAMAAKDGLE